MNLPADQRLRVLIDGDCALCNGLARFVTRRDSQARFEFIPGNRTDSVILQAGCRTYARSAAVLRILAGLGFPWSWLAPLGFLVPAAIRDAIYRAVAKNRKSLPCPLS